MFSSSSSFRSVAFLYYSAKVFSSFSPIKNVLRKNVHSSVSSHLRPTTFQFPLYSVVFSFSTGLTQLLLFILCELLFLRALVSLNSHLSPPSGFVSFFPVLLFSISNNNNNGLEEQILLKQQKQANIMPFKIDHFKIKTGGM